MTDVLFVCTGNLCRSPSAALLFEHELAHGGVGDVTVHSAGTSGADFGPPEALVKEGEAFGLDLGVHVPRQVDRDMIDRADLVIGMAREHVREMVLARPPRFANTFTLREIVRRGHAMGHRRAGEKLGEWLARLQEGRRHADLIGDSPEDDIEDPMGGAPGDYLRMLSEVADLIASLRRLAWPSDEERATYQDGVLSL